MNKLTKFKPNGVRTARPKSQVRRPKQPGQKSSTSGLQMLPAAITRPLGPQRAAAGRRVIRFKEYVQDIAGSVAFSATSFSVQPGLSTLFAWLAGQAANYQEYRFTMLRFAFETEKSSSTSGKLMLAFQPDAGDAVPASKQEMLENQFKAANAVWAPCSLSVPPNEALGSRRFIRTGTLASNLDIKTYDLGNLIVATQGCADTTAVGELYVEYDIELLTPVVSSAGQAQALNVVATAGGTISSSALFGTAATYAGGLAVTASANVLTFNRVGRYAISLIITGTGLFTSFVPVLTAPSGGSSGNLLGGISNAAANAGTLATVSLYCYVVSRGTTLTIDCSSQATSISACVAVITQYSA